MKKIILKSVLFLMLVGHVHAHPPEYKIKDYSALLGHVTGLDDALLSMHFTLYQGYVKTTNKLVAMLRQMETDGQDRTIAYGALKRRLSWELDGMLLHELYFENLGGKTPLSTKDPLYKEITETFGSFSKWAQIFKATGLMRGIGWVVLYREPKDGRLYNIWVDEHNGGLLAAGKPLLIMDVWEHAYITEFGLDRAKYIDVFFNNINWTVVSKRASQSM